jgi:hypothetical protein
MSNMNLRQRGSLNILLVPFIMLCLFLVIIGGFAYWAYNGRINYKDNSDKMSAAAVAVAEQQTEQNDAKIYALKAEDPLDTFVGPAAFGSVVVKYPKTYSAYVPEEPTSNTPIDGYFYPAVVPDVTSDTNIFALRVQLIEQSYSQVMQQFSGYVTEGTLSVSPYTLPKEPSVIGSYLTGQITDTKQGTMVVVPLLNMTLEIWTESSQFHSDFVNDVLPNVSFQS